MRLEEMKVKKKGGERSVHINSSGTHSLVQIKVFPQL
jgi:hypothetical protein